MNSYYGRPILKPHVWKPYVPLYFWIGGTAGVAAVHSAVERARGNRGLATVQLHAAFAGSLAAPVLLIADLGVPQRFLNMLRVFKITSPMSVGSWILSGFGAATGLATVAHLLGLEDVTTAAGAGAALLGPGLTTYTAVLLADTATPIWHDARAELPFVFVASGIAGAGAVGTAFAPAAERGSARRLMIAGALGMVATSRWMEQRLGAFIAEPYHTGKAGAWMKAMEALALGGAALGILGGKSAAMLRLGAALVAAAGTLERFTIFAAGHQSAQDPKYTVEPQRARIEAGEKAPLSAS